MAISQLYPTQRPALDLNFARQKRLDSRVTFTRGSTATYVGSDGLIKTAAAHEARFDHDPTTGESLGLLVETSSTNSHTRSEAYTSWTLSLDVNVSYGTGGPSPTGSGQFVTLTTTSATNTIRQSGPGSYFTIPVDGYVCYSLYVDAQNSSTGDMFIALGSAGSNYTRGIVTINADKTISTGTQWVGHDMYTPVSHGSYYLGGGIYRVWFVTQNTTASAWTIGAPGGIYPAANKPLGYTFHWWGFQCELGLAYPSSYIPTDGSTVTRSADVANLTNSSIYDTDSFTILNEPFGSAAGGSTLSLVGAGETPIKRTAVYSQDLTQTQINASVGKTDEFWRWRILGSSFGLPSFVTDGQVTVDWGDGTVETLTTSDHTFTDGGGYHEVGFRLDSGTYFRPYINNNATHKNKVVAVGPAPESMVIDGDRSFWGCSNLESFDATVDATGGASLYLAWNGCVNLKSFPLIDTSSGTNFQSAWTGCNSLTSFPLIDTSSGTNFRDAWYNCSGLTSFPLIDISSATTLQSSWLGCSGLTSFPLLNTSNVATFDSTWYNCTGLTSFPLLDTSSGTNFFRAWHNCNSLTSFPLLDTSSGTNFYRTWFQCSSLTSFPLIDTSSGTNFTEAWYNCTGLTSFPLIDTSSGTSFSNAWRNCSSLTSFPLIDTSSGTNFSVAWYGCNSLTSFPLIDTSSGTNFYTAWFGCNSLTSFPLINTSSGTNFSQAWQSCSSLTSFPLIDTSSGTNFTYAWYYCTSLTSFPANFFDSWTGTPVNNCFVGTWNACTSLTATSVENILNSIDTSGQSAPASVDITIDYNAGSGTPNITTAVTNLKSRGWTITLNGVAQ